MERTFLSIPTLQNCSQVSAKEKSLANFALREISSVGFRKPPSALRKEIGESPKPPCPVRTMKTALAFLAAAASVLFAAFLVPAATDSDSEGLPDADAYVQTSSFHETRPSVGLGGESNRERLLSLYDREAMGGMDFEEWFRLAGADEEGILCRAEADCEWINPGDSGLTCRAYGGTKIEVGTFYSDASRSLILDFFSFRIPAPVVRPPRGRPHPGGGRPGPLRLPRLQRNLAVGRRLPLLRPDRRRLLLPPPHGRGAPHLRRDGGVLGAVGQVLRRRVQGEECGAGAGGGNHDELKEESPEGEKNSLGRKLTFLPHCSLVCGTLFFRRLSFDAILCNAALHTCTLHFSTALEMKKNILLHRGCYSLLHTISPESQRRIDFFPFLRSFFC